MDGIEKITARILADAEAEARAIGAQAAEKVQEIRRQYDRQAQQEAQVILTRGEKTAAERLERLRADGQLERRKRLLAAKQQVLDETFHKALDDLSRMPEARRVAQLSAMAAKAAATGTEEVILSACDRARIGANVVAAANERLAGTAKAAAVTLSAQSRPMRGGFVMSDGEVEVNCTFEALIRMQRERLEKEVADILFA